MKDETSDIILFVTLILTLVDKNKIVQVSDRQLTRLDGKGHLYNVNKAVCVGMSHVHFSAAYTGLAHMGSTRTENRIDYWLLDQLGSITRDGRPTVEKICSVLGERAADALSKLRGDGFKGLEVVLAGYDRKNITFSATVSNMKFNSEGFFVDLREHFVSDVRWFHSWSPRPQLYVIGNLPAFQASDPTANALKNCRDKVVEYLKANGAKLTEERVAEALVWLIRAARTHKDHGYRIGRDCLSVVAFPREPRRRALLAQNIVVPREPEKTALFTAFYHPVAASSVYYAPHLADWYMDYMNVEGDTNPELLEGHEAPPSGELPKFGSTMRSSIRVKVHNLPGSQPT